MESWIERGSTGRCSGGLLFVASRLISERNSEDDGNEWEGGRSEANGDRVIRESLESERSWEAHIVMRGDTETDCIPWVGVLEGAFLRSQLLFKTKTT
jgi:hypothetical protein